MSRQICVYQEFLTPAHRAQIEATAKSVGFTVHFFNLNQLEEAKSCLPSCEVLYAQSPELLRTAPATLQWYCCSSAGVDAYCKDDGIFANPDCLMTNAAGAYGVTIAEHVVMVTLMLMRRIVDFQEGMALHGWPKPLPIRSIRGSRFTILGAGDIGTTVAHRMRDFGAAHITGVSRSGIARDAVYDEMHPFAALDSLLPETDVLVMALPSTPETVGILSGARIARLPAHALLVNVGRGSAIDQPALIDALNSGVIAGAALDVMTPEPLPADHPLRDTKNLILTPHLAGNMSLGYTCDRAVALFCEDLARYGAGEPLLHLVDRSRGY